MAYQRKTIDVWTLQGNNGYGWEDMTSELTRFDIRQRLKEYRENEPHSDYRIVNQREPRTAENAQEVAEAQALALIERRKVIAARKSKQAEAH